MWKGVQLFTFWFMLYYPDVALCYMEDFFDRFNKTFCTAYDVVQFSTSSETICSIMCSRTRDTSGCRGVCYDETTQICKMYGVPDMGSNSIQLTWISFRKMGASVNYDNTVGKCTGKGYGVPLPVTDDERSGMMDFAQEDFRIDLNDREKSGNFKTSEGKVPETTFWAADKPSHGAGQDCVWAEVKKNGNWNDLDCTSQVRVYCQKPKPLQCKEGVEIGVEPHRPDTEHCYIKRM